MMALTAAYDKAMEDYDVLVMPTITYKAPKLPTKDKGFAGKWLQSSAMTYILNHMQYMC